MLVEAAQILEHFWRVIGKQVQRLCWLRQHGFYNTSGESLVSKFNGYVSRVTAAFTRDRKMLNALNMVETRNIHGY